MSLYILEMSLLKKKLLGPRLPVALVCKFMVVWQHVHLGQQRCSKLALPLGLWLWSGYNTRCIFLPVEQASNPITKWLVIPNTNLATVAAGGVACLVPSFVAHRWVKSLIVFFLSSLYSTFQHCELNQAGGEGPSSSVPACFFCPVACRLHNFDKRLVHHK